MKSPAFTFFGIDFDYAVIKQDCKNYDYTL